MKILTVGDLHGLPIPDYVLESIDLYDKIVFIGDYVDSFTETSKEMKTNLLVLIQFAKDCPDKVVLLLGNHDIQYYFYRNEELFRQLKCSGFRSTYAYSLNEIFYEHRKLFKVVYQVDNFLFTHAGISNKYYNNYLLPMFENIPGHLDLPTLEDKLEFCFFAYNRFNPLFEVGPVRGGARDSAGGIFWADMTETQGDYLDGFHQIVGHSHRDKFYMCSDIFGSKSIAYIDILPQAEPDERLLDDKFLVVDTENYIVHRERDF